MSGLVELGLTVSGRNATPTIEQGATAVLSGAGQGVVPVGGAAIKGPAGMAQDAALGTFFNAVTGANAAPITGITGAAAAPAPVAADALSVTGATATAGGEVAGTTAEDFAGGVGFVKLGYDGLSFLYGYIAACR